MEKRFRPAPVDLLARWVFSGLDRDQILGLPRSSVTVPPASMAQQLLGQTLAAPLGVAAGPHTQLSHNIVAAWLCGARFIELKTVQVLDDIHVARPCIDSADETYNCEWSQELSLDESFSEYLHAWVIVHALAHRLGLPSPGTIFNMSVGYDLAGIQSAKVQRFLHRMRDASAELPAVVDAVAGVYPAVRDVPIPSRISGLITLSTMHGCPPAEIERIATYLLTDLGVDTWVKLNPTLLGPARLRGILNERMGYGIDVPDAAFEHDPGFDDAMTMVEHLRDVAGKADRSFGIKLSNTLEVVNHRPVFPSSEKMMYLSGRALHPLTLTLAHRVTERLDGTIPLSFCGGADAFNFPRLVADGLGPVTTCTDLLKPGGYARLAQYVDRLHAEMSTLEVTSLDEYIQRTSGEPQGTSSARCARRNLADHAERVVCERHLRSRSRPLVFKGTRQLGAFDCIAAPCQEACPTHQDVPGYMADVASGAPERALDRILHTNALPGVTGRVCDHPCVDRCVRNLYDEPLAIREIKRHAVERATRQPPVVRGKPVEAKVAVIGAGPAGLSAAYYLAQAGLSVTMFDARKDPGGMASRVIPTYRLPMQTILDDAARIRELGVEMRYEARAGRDFSIESLRNDGYDYVIVAAGAQVGRKLEIDGEDGEGVMDALEFLDAVRNGRTPEIGPRVLVIGGGNSAMDAARTAWRVVGTGTVSIVYRRTLDQMPADAEEIEAAQQEGVAIQELLAPVEVLREDGTVRALRCARMQLGEPDGSGRPRPVPIAGAHIELPCETILVGISQEPLLDFLDALGLQRRKDGTIKVDPETGETNVDDVFVGGDAARGPATVIKAVADGRRIASAIAARHGVRLREQPPRDVAPSRPELLEERTRRRPGNHPPELELERRKGFEQVLHPFDDESARAEASRCLRCDSMCSLCVTVCPNRANQAYECAPVRVELPSFAVADGELVVDGIRAFEVEQSTQIVNVADFCNECGNCTTFCPTAGAPWRDKPRIHLDERDYRAAPYDAFMIARNGDVTVVRARSGGQEHTLNAGPLLAEYRNAKLVVRWNRAGWEFVEAEPIAPLAADDTFDLSLCGTMIALLQAAAVIPA